LDPPPFTTAEVFSQLRYVEHYAGELDCQTIVIETPYIDRDHMEDHSTFYARNLTQYPNFCRRVHFFAKPSADVRRCLREAIEAGATAGLNAFRTKCSELSRSYLGFAVIKPLHGSAVGRTVLRPYPDVPTEPDRAQQFRRSFQGTRLYTTHLLGNELTVRGLAFQQQDAGVSACATTAIWSSLQKMSDHEDISPATPAQITALASRFSLPFGRAMPSEGLSIDQMCQAIQAMGVAPNLLRPPDTATAKSYLYSAIKSGSAPILILQFHATYHAVVAPGMKLRIHGERVRDAADRLIGLYVHDDRTGPYRRASLASDGQTPCLVIPEAGESPESWLLTHIIVPIYPKNRLSLPGLVEAALDVQGNVERLGELLGGFAESLPEPQVTVDYWACRPHSYLSQQFEADDTQPDLITTLFRTVPMPRYLGVIRASADWFGDVDLLIDTTSSRPNIQCLAAVAWTPNALSAWVAESLAEQYQCDTIRID